MYSLVRKVAGRHLARGREYFHPAREIIDYINVVRDDMGVPALPF